MTLSLLDEFDVNPRRPSLRAIKWNEDTRMFMKFILIAASLCVFSRAHAVTIVQANATGNMQAAVVPSAAPSSSVIELQPLDPSHLRSALSLTRKMAMALSGGSTATPAAAVRTALGLGAEQRLASGGSGGGGVDVYVGGDSNGGGDAAAVRTARAQVRNFSARDASGGGNGGGNNGGSGGGQSPGPSAATAFTGNSGTPGASVNLGQGSGTLGYAGPSVNMYSATTGNNRTAGGGVGEGGGTFGGGSALGGNTDIAQTNVNSGTTNGSGGGLLGSGNSFSGLTSVFGTNLAPLQTGDTSPAANVFTSNFLPSFVAENPTPVTATNSGSQNQNTGTQGGTAVAATQTTSPTFQTTGTSPVADNIFPVTSPVSVAVPAASNVVSVATPSAPVVASNAGGDAGAANNPSSTKRQIGDSSKIPSSTTGISDAKAKTDNCFGVLYDIFGYQHNFCDAENYQLTMDLKRKVTDADKRKLKESCEPKGIKMIDGSSSEQVNLQFRNETECNEYVAYAANMAKSKSDGKKIHSTLDP